MKIAPDKSHFFLTRVKLPGPIIEGTTITPLISDPNQPFYAMCKARNFRIGAALLQSLKGTNKMNLISASSTVITQAEFRLSTLMRECTAVIYNNRI